MKRLAYIGHYTDETKVGIRILEMDTDTGAFKVLGETKLGNAIWMAMTRDGARLYAACDGPEFGSAGNDGGITAFRVAADGSLEPFSILATGFTVPCHVCLSFDDQTLAWAEYRNGAIGTVELGADGKFLPETVRTVHHSEKGFSRLRPDTPHAHCVQITPDGKYLCAVDLALDEVKVYDFAARAWVLKEIPEMTLHTKPALGPRHLVFHPSGKWACIDFEMGGCVASYRYRDGIFEKISSLPTLPPDFDGHVECAAVKFSEDGRELYCSNYGHDSLTVFSFDLATGVLSPRKILPLGGSFPQDFEFFPGGKYLLACLKKSGIVRTYAYDREACTFEAVRELFGLYMPLFALFAPMKVETDDSVEGLSVRAWNGNGYKPVVRFGAWCFAELNHDAKFAAENLSYRERHLKTDEAFVLIDGKAKLLVGEKLSSVEMMRNKIYNVRAGAWHQIVTEPGARVLVVENDNVDDASEIEWLRHGKSKEKTTGEKT